VSTVVSWRNHLQTLAEYGLFELGEDAQLRVPLDQCISHSQWIDVVVRCISVLYVESPE